MKPGEVVSKCCNQWDRNFS